MVGLRCKKSFLLSIKLVLCLGPSNSEVLFLTCCSSSFERLFPIVKPVPYKTKSVPLWLCCAGG